MILTAAEEGVVVDGAPPQPQHLTVIGLVCNYGIYGGVGYVVAGATGLWCGVTVATLLLGRKVWQAARPAIDERVKAAGPDAAPGTLGEPQ